MITIRPSLIPGRWREGYALDLHTESSTHVGDDQYGHPHRSGATMSSIAAALHDQGGSANVFALTVTRTRSRR